jgi:hypothetical protein
MIGAAKLPELCKVTPATERFLDACGVIDRVIDRTTT